MSKVYQVQNKTKLNLNADLGPAEEMLNIVGQIFILTVSDPVIWMHILMNIIWFFGLKLKLNKYFILQLSKRHVVSLPCDNLTAL
jgi:hypothetical protein